MKILKAEHRLTPRDTPFKKKDTIVENSLFFYLVNHVYSQSCGFQTWTFDIASDIILDIEPKKDKAYAEMIERRANRYNSIFGRSRKKQNKEASTGKWYKEKFEAAKKLEKRMDRDNKAAVNGMLEIDTKLFGDNKIPDFDKTKDTMFTADHVSPPVDTAGKAIELVDLLDDYFKTNLMNNKDNYYTCERCRKTVDMEKNIMFITHTLRIYNPSESIAITLKRFRQTSSYSFWNSGYSKVNTQVNFPKHIDLTKYCMSKFG